MKDKTFGEICGNKHNGKCPNCPACEHNRLYRGLQREQKMKNKLKKIETLNPNEYNGGHGNYVEDTFYKIEKKINEIIDYINEKEKK